MCRREEGKVTEGHQDFLALAKPPCQLLGNHTLWKTFSLSVPHHSQRQAAFYSHYPLCDHLEELFPQKSQGSLQCRLYGYPNSAFMKRFAVKPGGLHYLPDDLLCYFVIIVHNFIWNLTSAFDPLREQQWGSVSRCLTCSTNLTEFHPLFSTG